MPGRAVGLGALAALVYALVHVLWRGVVVDETLVSAQILAGAVRYPPGHPHLVFHVQAFSLPNLLSALLLRLAPGVELVSGARNVLFLFLSAYVPFLVTTVLTRRASWGAVAAALALTDPVWRFKGVYPLFVFPTFYSHGHVGAYGALLVAALLVAGRRRIGGLLLGLFPAVHPLLALVLWGWGAWLLGAARARPRGRERRRVLAWAALGAVGALAVLLDARRRAAALEPAVPGGPYEVGGDAGTPEAAAETAERVRRGFLELTDLHRQMPPWDSSTFLLGYVANALLFLAGAAVLRDLLRRRGQRPGSDAARALADGAGALLGLGMLAWALVGGARVLHALLGRLPAALETAMPNRLSNLSAMLLVPLFVACLAALVPPVRGAAGRWSRWRVGAALLALGLLAGAGAVAWLRSASTVWIGPDYRLVPALALFGVVLAAASVRARGVARLLALVAAAGLGGVLASQRSWMGVEPALVLGASLVAGWLGAWLLGAPVEGGDGAAADEAAGEVPGAGAAAFGVALLCAIAALPTDQADEGSRPGAFERDLAAWLGENAGPDELLLPPLLPRTQLQATTGRPVLLELGTLWLMPYLPELSAVIGRLVEDVYGVDYADREALAALAPQGFLGQHSPVWRRAWERRGREEWRALGARYGLRLVLAPTDWDLDLVPELVTGDWVLYGIR